MLSPTFGGTVCKTVKPCHLGAAVSFFYVKGNFNIALTHLQLLYRLFSLFLLFQNIITILKVSFCLHSDGREA